jgi:hypothetical protein
VDTPDLAKLRGLSLVEAIDRFCNARLASLAEKVRTMEPDPHALARPTPQGFDEHEYKSALKANLAQGRTVSADRIAAQRWICFSPDSSLIRWAADKLSPQDYQVLAREIVEVNKPLIQALSKSRLFASGILEPAASSGHKQAMIRPAVFRIGRWVLYRDSGSRLVILNAHGKKEMIYSAVRLFLPDKVVTSTASSSAATKGNSNVVKFPRKGGRPTERDAIRKTLEEMKSNEFDFNTPHKVIAAKVASLNNIKLNAVKGWSERTVIEHVVEWLEENGLDNP